MRSFKKIFCLLAVLNIAFISCQKDFTVEEEIDPPVIVNDSNYLDKVYHVFSNGTVSDTFITQLYQYDANKRVTAIDVTEVPSLLHPGFIYNTRQKWLFQYNGTQLLPLETQYILDLVAPSSSSADTIHTYHFFNAAGKKTRDSVVAENHSITAASGEYFTIEKLVTNYTYAGNNVYALSNSTITHIIPAQPDETYALRDTIVTDSRGNAVSWLNYYVGFDTPLNDEFYAYESSVSPMQKLNINKALPLAAVDTTIYPVTQTYNNRIRSTWRNIGSPDQFQDLAGKYILNAAGFPAQINMGPNTDFPALHYRIFFVYRHF
ncbi:MAG: hypothetical protein H7Y86_21120 [Rhizobacter sp.]|nr:hypothetical protein [Ferruginibacter sp.]